MTDEVRVPIVADTAPFETALENLSKLATSFGTQLTGALKGAVVGGKSLEDVLRRVGLNLAGMALQQGLQPLQNMAGSLFGGLVRGISGAVSPGAGIMPFAKGGVVASPTFFPTGRGTGLMGEAGAEAILPLRRGADGRLGVAAGGGAAGPNIVFNVTTSDATSFRKSEAQIAGMLARAVSRGARTM